MQAEFSAFVRAVHGHEAFPWQCRAAESLCAGEPPDGICVPTGAGKTSILDAAIFAMSRGATWRRVVYTVDRRLVVDGVTEHANRIAAALAGSADPAVRDVAHGLKGNLRVVRLRGGMPLDDEWVLHPEDPCILVTTVDQAGSRLLFRGYGVSSRQAPIHAAMVGCDALHVLDEAHLSHAYLNTLRACRGHGARIDVVEMTATPSAELAKIIALAEPDRSHTVLRARLEASKRARLIGSTAGKLTKTLVAEAVALRESGGQVVGVVVNTVNRARDVFQMLAARGDAVLLTGRVRPFERDALVEALLPRIRAGRDRTHSDALYVVATQTIEVGADLDFDALVSECASLSALRQRFGRLDRLGRKGVSSAVIVYAAKSDKIYGTSYDSAWTWMQSQATESVLDFGIDAFGKNPPPPSEPGLPAPPLVRTHINLLSMTGVASPQIDIGPWLHGIERPGAEVTIVWRADLDPERPKDWSTITALMPPMSAESLALPMHAARMWLQRGEAADVADVATTVAASGRNRSGRKALCWDGEQGVVIEASSIRAGDSLVVPAQYGGCDEMGWNPGYTATVTDFAEAVRNAAGRPERRRLHPAIEADDALVHLARAWAALVRTPPDSTEQDFEEFDAQVADAERCLIEHLRPEGPVVLDPYPDGEGAVMRRIGADFGQVLQTGRPIPLADHLRGVGAWARHLAEALGADVDRLERSGHLHDEGKRVGAFQTMLYGSPVHAEPLAKSGLTGSAAREAWQRSGLARGFRHEAASVAMSEVADPLLRHLVGTHHGHGRPWFPICDDAQLPGSSLARIDGGWLQQFAELRDAHGPWELAWQEMILRVADARRSIEEQQS